MIISKYDGHFHDGYLRNIIHKGHNIELFLESCILNPEDILEKNLLSDINKLKGVLRVRSVKSIIVDDHTFLSTLKMLYDYAEILTLKTEKKSLYLLIEWDNNPPKPEVREIGEIKIEADEIYWENQPKGHGSHANEKH